MSLKPLGLQRATRTKEEVSMLEGSQQFRVVYEDMEAEGKVMVREEDEAAGAPLAHYSVEWTANTSNNASVQVGCNRWVLKETPTSLRSAYSPTRKIWRRVPF